MLLEVVARLDGVAIAEAHRLVGLGDIVEAVALDRAVTVRKISRRAVMRRAHVDAASLRWFRS